MYQSRDSDEAVRPPTPQGYETLGKVIDSTMWIESRLRWLERGKPYKRISALRTNLAKMLDDDSFGQLVVSRDDHSKILSDVTQQYQAEIDRIKLELDKSKEECKTLKFDLQEARDLDLSDKDTPSSSPFRSVRFLVVWTVVVMIATAVLTHHS